MNRNFDLLLGLRLASAGLGFLIIMALGWMLGPDGLGAYVFALGWLKIAMLLVTMGFHHYCIRALPPMKVTSAMGEMRGLITLSALFCIGVGIALTLATPSLVAAFELSPDPAMERAVVAGSLLLLPLALIQLRGGVMRGFDRPIAAQIPELVLQPGLFLAAISAVWLFGVTFTAERALYLAALAATLALLAGTGPLLSVLGNVRGITAAFAPRRWFAEAGKSAFLFAVGALMAATDVIMLGLLSNATETGIYGVASRFFLFMQIPALAASGAISHQVAHLKATGDTAGLNTLVRTTTRRTALATAGLGLIATLPALAPELLFGAGFAAASLPMLVMIWGRVIEGILGHPSSVLANAGGVGLTAICIGGGIILNAGLNLVLIPKFGALGAALATSGAYLLLTCVIAGFVWRRLGILCLPINTRKGPLGP